MCMGSYRAAVTVGAGSRLTSLRVAFWAAEDDSWELHELLGPEMLLDQAASSQLYFDP